MKARVALVAIVAATFYLWLSRLDVAYFFSLRTPISLGAEGEYHFDRLASNRYAQVHGIPTSRGEYSGDGKRTFVVVGLRETPLLVYREALPGEEWKGGVPPRPNQAPFAVRGRLLARADAGRYEEGFRKFEAAGEVRPGWILVEGVQPGRPATGLLLAGVGLFVAVNLWFLVRSLAR